MTVRSISGIVGLLLTSVVMLACEPAEAMTRVALVIGNSAYRNVPPLANPDNDAAAFAATMTQAGFDVVDARDDLTADGMRRALREFGDKFEAATRQATGS